MNEATEVDGLLDGDGFLIDPSRWNQELARQLAKRLDVTELGDAHWRIIARLRAHFDQGGNLPVQRTLCREVELDEDCIRAWFGGPLEAWTIAGLPNPGEEARVYMEDMEAEPRNDAA
jgi:tRNA 2-thiouridine synthesizing protein E